MWAAVTLYRVALPTRIQKFTVLKSAHIFKKQRVQYEIRTHSRLVQIKHITGTTADVYLEYIQRNLPEGISMSVHQVYIMRIRKIVHLASSPGPFPAFQLSIPYCFYVCVSLYDAGTIEHPTVTIKKSLRNTRTRGESQKRASIVTRTCNRSARRPFTKVLKCIHYVQ